MNGISSHQRPAWNKWKKKRETERVQRAEAVKAIVDLIAQARERGDTETVEKLTDVEDSLQVPYQSEMDWNGNENDDDGNRIWESLTSTNLLVDVARLHCNIELEQDKASVLNELVQITANLCRICFLLPLPGPSPTSTLRRTRTQHPRRPHSSQSLQHHPPSFLSRCPHPLLRYKNLMKLKLNMTRCKHRKIQCGSVLSLLLLPVSSRCCSS